MTKANPMGHGLGGPEGVLFAAMPKGIASTPLPGGSDPGIQARFAAAVLLYTAVRELPPVVVGEFATHVVIAELQGNRKGTAIISFKIDGRPTLPTHPTDLTTCRAAVEAAFATDSVTALSKLAPSCFHLEDGVPVPPTGHGVEIRMLATLMCVTGGTKAPGKAPAGAQVRVVKGKGKSKGK